MSEIATTPEPPYYAVIFTSFRNEDDKGYSEMADKMVTLASQQPGFLGVESAHESVGITVSYWSDLDAIKQWKMNADHLVAQQKGRDVWYSEFKIRISKVERDYSMVKD